MTLEITQSAGSAISKVFSGSYEDALRQCNLSEVVT